MGLPWRVEREVTLPASREEVWRALSDPSRLSAWLGGEVDLELVPGGRGLIRQQDGEVRLVVVEEVMAPKRLVFRWWGVTGRSTTPATVELTLTELPEEGTRLSVVEQTSQVESRLRFSEPVNSVR